MQNFYILPYYTEQLLINDLLHDLYLAISVTTWLNLLFLVFCFKIVPQLR